MTCLLIEIDGPVMILTLNRPDARNAISPELIVRLDAACIEARDNPDIRAVIITAAQGPVFCAGGDLKLMIPLITGMRKADDHYDRETLALMKAKDRPLPMESDIGKPLISAIEGAALGGGLELILASDLIIAGSKASFGAPEVAAGAYPARITHLLPKRLPYSIASRMMLAAQIIDAKEAATHGLVSQLVNAGDALKTALKFAHKISENAPISVQAAREVARASLSGDANEIESLDRKMARRVYASQDAREGPRAFAEKRKAEFKGV